MRFSIRRRAINKRRSISLIPQPAGTLTKTCLIAGKLAAAIDPNTAGLMATSRQAVIVSVSFVNSSLIIA